jgi:hypothetical protein
MRSLLAGRAGGWKPGRENPIPDGLAHGKPTLPQEFELYGSRFRWFAADAPGPLAGLWIPLIRMLRPLPSETVVWVSHSQADRLSYGKSAAGFVYRFEDIGEFLLPLDGSFVQAFLNPQAEPWAIDFVLCRGVIPRLLHLRGVTCLHAGAVAVGDRVVAFCGPSGSGKSTLTAALAIRGYRVVTDDVLPLCASPPGDAVLAGPILAGPGLPEVRVYPAAAARIGIADRVIPPGAGQTKAVWRPESFVTAALPLAGIYLLAPHAETDSNFGSHASASPVSPRDALLGLLFHSFWLDPGQTGALATDLARLAQMVRAVPIARLSFEISEGGFDLVERLIASLSVSPVCQ